MNKESKVFYEKINKEFLKGTPCVVKLYDLFANKVIEDELIRLSLKCNYCGRILSNIKACNKHEEKCKTIPHKKYKDFLDMVNGNEFLLSIKQSQGLSLCIEVHRTWNNYTTHEILRPNGNIDIVLDPLFLKLIPKWNELNAEHIKKFGKPLPEFRNN